MKLYYYNVTELIFEINSSKICCWLAYGLHCLPETSGGDAGQIGCGALTFVGCFMTQQADHPYPSDIWMGVSEVKSIRCTGTSET